MSNLQSVGQHFMLGLRPTPTLHPQDRELLRDLRLTGVVLIKGNFSHDCPYTDWLGWRGDLIASIREAAGRERLVIAIDHGGAHLPHPIANHAIRLCTGLTRDTTKKGVQLEFTVEDPAVCATPRSGWTTYRRLIGDSPQAVCAENLHFLARAPRSPGAHTDFSAGDSMVRDCLEPITDEKSCLR